MKASVLSTVLALAPSALAYHRFRKPEGPKCGSGPKYEIQYSTVPGFFLQDEPSIDSSNFDYANVNFGLINRTYPTDESCTGGPKTQWQRFQQYVDSLNDEAEPTVTFKVLHLGRHGEGEHNAAESFYGTPAWNCFWGEQDGNGTAVFKDAHLTDAGFAQAEKAHAYYTMQFEQGGLPFFERYFVSPLTRCIQTANTTFATIDLPSTHLFTPIIKEYLRETISVHTCDERMNKTSIHEFAPNFVFEPGFTELDELWQGNLDEGETSAHQIARSKVLLDQIFSTDDATWISFTSHSGEIHSILSVLGHQPWNLNTGQIVVTLVRAEYVEQQNQNATATASSPSFTHEVLCSAPPLTSIMGEGCICSATATPTPTPTSCE